MEFPTIDKFAKDVAEKALNEITYEGKTLREWIEIIVKLQPYEDCISREQTLKAFAEKCGGECACCKYNGSGYDTAENCQLIKSMPSVTPKVEWIPVSEKLPNSYEYVLATMISPVTQLPFVCKLYTGENAKEKIEESKVIAWMVLPKPYKEKK